MRPSSLLVNLFLFERDAITAGLLPGRNQKKKNTLIPRLKFLAGKIYGGGSVLPLDPTIFFWRGLRVFSEYWAKNRNRFLWQTANCLLQKKKSSSFPPLRRRPSWAWAWDSGDERASARPKPSLAKPPFSRRPRNGIGIPVDRRGRVG